MPSGASLESITAVRSFAGLHSGVPVPPTAYSRLPSSEAMEEAVCHYGFRFPWRQRRGITRWADL